MLMRRIFTCRVMNFSSADENIYRQIMPTKHSCRRKILPFLEFSKTGSEDYFSLKWHKNIDDPVCDLTFDLQ